MSAVLRGCRHFTTMPIWDADSMTDFSSWTDADLVRACETDPECKQQYVDELAARAIARAKLAEQTNRLQADVAAKVKELLDGGTRT